MINRHRRYLPRFSAVAVLLATLAGCFGTVPPTQVHQPMSARPAPVPQPTIANGAIYQSSAGSQRFYGYRPLFEDRRPRAVGDTLIIQIAEKTAASKKSNSTAERTGSVDFSISDIAKLPGNGFDGAAAKGSSANKFDGKGESGSNNDFTGTIAVTVIEVFPNGNLLVSGEKQIGINQGSEYIRFSGVVNPNSLTNGNTVVSTQVADARIEYRSSGYIDEAQVIGWLARFFLTFLPF